MAILGYFTLSAALVGIGVSIVAVWRAQKADELKDVAPSLRPIVTRVFGMVLLLIVATTTSVYLMTGSSDGPAMSDSNVFVAGNPFPRGLDIVKPGMPLSLVRAVYPDGTVTDGGYRIDLRSGSFTAVSFVFDNARDINPIVDIVLYHLREGAAKTLRRQALAVFGPKNAQSGMLGENLTWSDIAGFDLTINSSAVTITRPPRTKPGVVSSMKPSKH